MAVFEFKIEVTLNAVPMIEDLLAEREEQRLMVMEDKPSGRAWLTGYFQAMSEAQTVWTEFAESLAGGWLISAPELRELADVDWKESYKAHFKAWQFGSLHWVPVWERQTFRLPPGEQVLWLDPGMAFGTGNHETTRLVVERLVQLTEQGGTGGRVIDAGCGSGILALSAAKLGYRDIVAFDNDALSVEVSLANAVMNELAGRVDFFVGDLVSGLSGRQAELVLANIQADVLMLFKTQLLGAVAPKGVLVLSGILAQELAQVREVFSAAVPDWSVDSRVMGEWSDLVLTRS
jgi:ribosomal protein L11 methyltransferase